MKRAIDWGLPMIAAALLAWALMPHGPDFVRLPTGGGMLNPWSYTNLQGRTVASSEFTNQVLIINYWATFCPPCLAEIPHFNAFYEKYHKSGLEIIGIANDQEGSKIVEPFVKRHEIKYPVVLYDFPSMPPFGGQIPLPTTLIVNRAGKIVARYVGALSEEELEKTVAPLLTEKVTPRS